MFTEEMKGDEGRDRRDEEEEEVARTAAETVTRVEDGREESGSEDSDEDCTVGSEMDDMWCL